ncbi:MAG: uracil-DNA glycosylase [Rickettsiales bacterium]|nr:uracil-DNA glycosylase [Rickettsiales bacterium]
MEKKKTKRLIDDLELQSSMGVDTFVEKKAVNRFNRMNYDIETKNSNPGSEIPKPPPIKQQENFISSEDILKKCSNLSDLCESLKKFNGSNLKKTASQIVFSDGNPKAKIMLIGEAPGADEDRLGKPFVGVSGQLLDKMLDSINLNREKAYLTNIVPWRPPGNRTPTDYELALFKPFLLKHIELVNPKIIVAVGGSAAKALLNINDGILRHRGIWKKLVINEKLIIDIIATLHPAYLLRSPSQKKLAWADLKQIRDKLKEL